MRVNVRMGYQMAAKRYLCELANLSRRIAVLNEEIEARRAKLTSVSVPITGDRV